jgi:hypothetical protein
MKETIPSKSPTASCHGLCGLNYVVRTKLLNAIVCRREKVWDFESNFLKKISDLQPPIANTPLMLQSISKKANCDQRSSLNTILFFSMSTSFNYPPFVPIAAKLRQGSFSVHCFGLYHAKQLIILSCPSAFLSSNILLSVLDLKSHTLRVPSNPIDPRRLLS